MISFSIFIPLFLLIPCIVYLMDLHLQKVASWNSRFGWEPTRPDYGLTLQPHRGMTSHMRAIQLNPRFRQARRNRPHIAKQFPIRRIVTS